MKKLLIIILLAFSLPLTIIVMMTNAYAFDLITNVTRVIDGDTIQLENGDRIRLSIVDTPERGEQGFKEATKFTSDHCLGKTVLIDYDDKQKVKSYYRTVAAVYCVDFLNLELLKSGNAIVDQRYCDKSEFKKELCK